jgi:hypothetical protein
MLLEEVAQVGVVDSTHQVWFFIQAFSLSFWIVPDNLSLLCTYVCYSWWWHYILLCAQWSLDMGQCSILLFWQVCV